MAFEQNIYLAADTIVVANKKVLLIKRKFDPFQGMWAFPGGFVDEGEDLMHAASRELMEETGVEVKAEQLLQFRSYGKLGRDPRFHTVSVVFSIRLYDQPLAIAADDAAEVAWFELTELPDMAFDHKEILEEFLGTTT